MEHVTQNHLIIYPEEKDDLMSIYKHDNHLESRPISEKDLKEEQEPKLE